MKFYKSVMFLTTVFSTSFPLTLSAVTFEELDKKIRTARACLAPLELTEKPDASIPLKID